MDRISRIATQFFNLTMRIAGILSKDKSREDVRAGDFIDALNTRSITDDGQTTDSRQNIRGNEYVFKPDAIALQNKKFRVYLEDGDYSTGAGNVVLQLSVNSVIVTATVHYVSGLIPYTQIYTDLINELTTAWATQNYTPSGLTSTTSTTGYFDIEVSTIPAWDYTLTGTGEGIAEVITIREAYDQSLIGDWNLIGSWYLQGELILWWTTQRSLPEDLTIASITNNGAGRFRIQTTTAHGLSTGEKVVVKNSGLANGQWIITSMFSTVFDLQGSTFSPITLTSTSKVTINPQGIGELGRAVKNENDGTWSYIRLIRAKALNWVTQHQQDTLCKKDALRKYYRYTDDYNPIGNLYDRTLVYQNDCLLSFVDSRNTYSYDNIGQESQFIQNGANYTFEFTTQDQSGGAILSGNSRFAIRLVTDTLVNTTWSPLTNPVPASDSSETGSAYVWSGNVPNFVTNKINNFLLEGDGISDKYKWAQIAVINYQGDAITGLLLPKVLVTSDSMSLRWTGSEQTEDLDVGTVQEITFGYKTALSLDELDGRIIFSNLTSSQTYDLTGWAESFEHSIKIKEMPAIGSRRNSTLTINEYEKSENVNSYVGYMLNETYRFGFIAEFYDGGESLAYHIQDITINTDAIFPRRISALLNYNLTDATATIVYVPYVQFSFDWEFLINGVPAKDIVRRIRIVRVEMTDGVKEILGSGVIVMSVDGSYTGTNECVQGVSVYPRDIVIQSEYNHTNYYNDWFFADGIRFDDPTPTPVIINPLYGTWGAPQGAKRRKLGSIYAPDYIFEAESWSYSAGDKLIVIGSPTTINFGGFTSAQIGGTPLPEDAQFWNALREFTGYTNTTLPTTYNIIDKEDISTGGSGTIDGETYQKKADWRAYQPSSSIIKEEGSINYPSSPVVAVNLNISYQGAGSDFGVYMTQVYRQKTDKFGDVAASRYVTTGAELDDKSITTIDVFGGDVFTQKTWLQHRARNTYVINSGIGWLQSGLGGGIAFYSQNGVNTQQTDRNNSSDFWKYPNIDEKTWVNNQTSNNTLSYNSGYNIRNQIQSYAAYNPDQSLVAGDFPVRLIYGEKANPEQASDTQRIFLPLNFTDLQYKDGEIVNHKVVNSELCAWQEGYFSRLYFHSNRLITTQSGAEVITGTGAAFTNRPLNITSYGCSNKWAILIGRSAGGNQTAYWMSDKLRSFIRFGGDGTTNQGVIHGIDSFLRYNLNLAVGKRAPAHEQGIHSVWNEAFKEAIFTVRAWREGVNDWSSSSSYQAGQAVEYGTRGFEEIPAFYIANSTLSPSPTPPNQSASWDLVPLSNYLYYNFYTLVFNELRNGFDGFVSFRPKIYAQYDNTILSPRPASNSGELYEHGIGNWCHFYDNGTTKQAEDGKTRVVFNADPAAAKEYLALIMWTEETPYRMNFKTAEHESYLDESEFEEREGRFYSEIKADSTVTTVPSVYGASANPLGLNSEDTTAPIYGNFLEIELIFKNGVKQIWSSTLIKGQLRDRKNNT